MAIRRSNKEKILELIQAGSDEPFQEELAKFMDCSPTKKSIQEYANKYPDRWAQAMTMLRKASGYTDKNEHTVNKNIYVAISTASDSELAVLEKQAEDDLRALTGNIIEGEFVEQ